MDPLVAELNNLIVQISLLDQKAIQGTPDDIESKQIHDKITAAMPMLKLALQYLSGYHLR